VVDNLQGFSTIRRQVSLQGIEQLALPCRPCLWLPLLLLKIRTQPHLGCCLAAATAAASAIFIAVRRAIQRTRDTSATGDDGIGPAFIKHAVLGGTTHTPDHVLAPLLGRLLRAVLC
jgi:hypothetical protein